MAKPIIEWEVDKKFGIPQDNPKKSKRKKYKRKFKKSGTKKQFEERRKGLKKHKRMVKPFKTDMASFVREALSNN